MSVKYFCDECEIEVADPSNSLDMTGKILCSKHLHEYRDKTKSYNYTTEWKSWNQNRFPKNIDAIMCPNCGKDTGYTHRGLMFLVVFHDMNCPHCGTVIVPANNGISFS